MPCWYLLCLILYKYIENEDGVSLDVTQYGVTDGTFSSSGINVANSGQKNPTLLLFKRIHTSFSTHNLGTDEGCVMAKAVGPCLNCCRPWKLNVGGRERSLRQLNAT